MRATVAVGEFGSLLVILMLPESLPAVVGVNDTFIVALPPGTIVLGVAMPEIPNGPAFTEINEMIRFAPPVFVSVSEPFNVVPTIALPKLSVVELKLICCGGVVATPESVTCPDETPLSVCTVNVPVTVPAALGSNHTWNVLDCPTGNARGMLIPETANWPLDTLAAVTLIEVFPVFEIVAVCEIFLPTTRLPKLKLPGVTWIAACCPDWDFVPPALTKPAQPINNKTGASKRMVGSVRCHQRCPIFRCGWSDRFRNIMHPKRIEFTIPRFTSRREFGTRSHKISRAF